jgi:hypothetical protein
MLELAVAANDEEPSQTLADVDETDALPGPFDDLRLLAEALTRMSETGRRPIAWRRPGFIREVAIVRTHLAPIPTRVLLAASFGREASCHATGPPTPDRAAGHVSTSAVHVAYAIRWLELATADRVVSLLSDSEQRMTRSIREGDRARRSHLMVRLGDARRRRLSATAVIASRKPEPARQTPSGTVDSAAEPDALIWFG